MAGRVHWNKPTSRAALQRTQRAGASDSLSFLNVRPRSSPASVATISSGERTGADHDGNAFPVLRAFSSEIVRPAHTLRDLTDRFPSRTSRSSSVMEIPIRLGLVRETRFVSRPPRAPIGTQTVAPLHRLHAARHTPRETSPPWPATRARSRQIDMRDDDSWEPPSPVETPFT
jgi:hypothetical protein